MSLKEQLPGPSGTSHMQTRPGELPANQGREAEADQQGIDGMLNRRLERHVAAERPDDTGESTSNTNPDLVTGMGGGDDPISEGVEVPSDLEEMDE